jgi:hypothetical protein
VRGAILALLLCVALGACSAAAGSTQLAVKVTLSGTCASKNTDDHNGVVISSTLTCQAKGDCNTCAAATRLVYETTTVSPGNGAPGKLRGTITATGRHDSVTLALLGTSATNMAGIALGKGTWTLGHLSGVSRASLVRGGTYTTETTTVTSIPGTTETTVRISAAIGCWTCAPQR